MCLSWSYSIYKSCATRVWERIILEGASVWPHVVAFIFLKGLCVLHEGNTEFGVHTRGTEQEEISSLCSRSEKFTLFRGFISLILSIQKLRLCHWICPLLLPLGHCFSCEVTYRLEKAFYLLRRWNLETGSLQKMPNLLPWEFLNQVRKISFREELSTFCPGTEALSGILHFTMFALPQSPCFFLSSQFFRISLPPLIFCTQPYW